MAWIGIFCGAGAYGFLRSPVPGRPWRAFFLALLIIALMAGRLLMIRMGDRNYNDSLGWFLMITFSAPIVLVLPLGVWLGVYIRLQKDEGNKAEETR